jgi:hypothetical protein
MGFDGSARIVRGFDKLSLHIARGFDRAQLKSYRSLMGTKSRVRMPV